LIWVPLTRGKANWDSSNDLSALQKGLSYETFNPSLETGLTWTGSHTLWAGPGV
jgi:hypothetical protein